MALSRSPSSVGNALTVIAIDRDKLIGQALVKWAVDNLLRGKKKSHCAIIHVMDHSAITHSQTNSVSKGSEEDIQHIFLPCLGYCARKGITAKEMIIHDIDVPSAILDYVINNQASNVVVGASNRNAIIRKFKDADVPSSLLKSVPEFCSVYVISKGKTQTVRTATKKLALPKPYANKSNSSSDPMWQTSRSSDWTSSSTSSSSTSGNGNRRSKGSVDFSSLLMGSHRSQDSVDFSSMHSFQSSASLDSLTDLENSFSLPTHEELNSERSRLNILLKQYTDTYNSTSDEAKAAKDKVEGLVFKDGEEAAAAAMDEVERKKTEAAERVAGIEKHKSKIAEMRAMQEESGGGAHGGGAQYRRYSTKEIESATDYFNEKKKVGEGGYGPVYKGFLDHTPVAIKILRPDISQGLVQFQQEVDVLGSIRHPNMVLLVGACPEYGCLVYEYMENGSLEDRLFRKDNTPPVPWRDRFRIAAEIGTALLFLHQRKPEPLVHRDLKPANILLGANYSSKISDVGLARLVPAAGPGGAATQYHETEAAGTFCYIDPEYQQTGLLGVKSDVYSFGVVLLQIITSRPPIGLSYLIEEAIEEGEFNRVLDPAVADWPVAEALSFARVALRCCEMLRKDRADLGSVVLPELNRLRDFAMRRDDGA